MESGDNFPFAHTFSSWSDVDMRNPVDGCAGLAAFFFSGSLLEEDDASSIASNEDEPLVATSFPKKEFPTFDDPRASVLSCARLAPSQVRDNSRSACKVE